MVSSDAIKRGDAEMEKIINTINGGAGIEMSMTDNGTLVLIAKFPNEIETVRRIPVEELQKLIDGKEKYLKHKGEDDEELIIHVVPGERHLTTKQEMIELYFEPPTEGMDLLIVEKDDFISAVRGLTK